MAKLNLTFIKNNVKGLQSSNKRLKIIKYFKDNLCTDEILLLQKTHLTFILRSSVAIPFQLKKKQVAN